MSAIGALFGGGKKAEPTVQPPSPQVNQEPAPGDKKKNIVRALLLGTTTPEGDLSPVTTGRRKLLGN